MRYSIVFRIVGSSREIFAISKLEIIVLIAFFYSQKCVGPFFVIHNCRLSQKFFPCRLSRSMLKISGSLINVCHIKSPPILRGLDSNEFSIKTLWQTCKLILCHFNGHGYLQWFMYSFTQTGRVLILSTVYRLCRLWRIAS